MAVTIVTAEQMDEQRRKAIVPGITPTLTRVDITTDDDGITVTPIWSGVDRERGSGIGLGLGPKHRALAARLKAAMLAGVVFTPAVAMRDINGHTFASYAHNVMGRHLNADLARLGF